MSPKGGGGGGRYANSSLVLGFFSAAEIQPHSRFPHPFLVGHRRPTTEEKEEEERFLLGDSVAAAAGWDPG